MVLVTNRPEMAAYIELFNGHSEDLKVELEYRKDPIQALEPGGPRADLVLAPWMTGEQAAGRLESLDRLFGEDKLHREGFYRELLDSGVHDRRQVALPVCFNLPTVVFAPQDELPSLTMPLELLRERAGEFNKTVRGRFIQMGFSPLWDSQTPYTTAALLGAGFREATGGGLTWDRKSLEQAVRYLRDWIREVDGGYAQEREFFRKYMYEPMPKLVDQRRILFYQTDSSRLFESLAEHREEADFRWLSAEGKIPVEDDVLYLGIPKGAHNRLGARRFLLWFFHPETQKELLRIDRRKRLRTFGVAGGFSALKEINQREFPQAYPLLIGRVAGEEFLRFPRPLPPGWGTLKREVVIPWLTESAAAGEEEESLGERLSSFRATNPNP